MKVENQNQTDRKLDDDSQVVEKVEDDNPEVFVKEIDDNLKGKVSLNNIYVHEANGKDEDLEDTEATKAEVSPVNDPTLPQLDLNASFVKETHVELHPEETFENIIGNTIVNIKEVEVVVSKSEDQLQDAKHDQDSFENDDVDSVDVKVEISKVSDRESISEDDEETEQQLNHKLIPNVLDGDENLVAETECIEAKLLFVGTFLENYEDILKILDKFVDENKQEGANQKEGFVAETEIRKKDSKCEGSRYELEVVADEEKLMKKRLMTSTNHLQEINLQDVTMIVLCLIQTNLTMWNTMMKFSCVVSGIPLSKKFLPLVPINLEKFLAMICSIIVVLKEDVVEKETASADNFTVT